LKFPIALVVGLCFVTSGCSHVSDGVAETLASDPSQYDFFDCTQLAGERKTLTEQLENMRKQMEKYEAGFGGSIINEAVVQPEVISVRGRLKRVNDAWVDLKCTIQVTPAVGPIAKSKNAVY
jgi:hypothetical protein